VFTIFVNTHRESNLELLTKRGVGIRDILLGTSGNSLLLSDASRSLPCYLRQHLLSGACLALSIDDIVSDTRIVLPLVDDNMAREGTCSIELVMVSAALQDIKHDIGACGNYPIWWK
jgi:hypothetical protein